MSVKQKRLLMIAGIAVLLLAAIIVIASRPWISQSYAVSHLSDMTLNAKSDEGGYFADITVAGRRITVEIAGDEEVRAILWDSLLPGHTYVGCTLEIVVPVKEGRAEGLVGFSKFIDVDKLLKDGEALSKYAKLRRVQAV